MGYDDEWEKVYSDKYSVIFKRKLSGGIDEEKNAPN